MLIITNSFAQIIPCKTVTYVKVADKAIDIRVSGKPVQVIDHPEATATREQLTAMELGIRDTMI